MTMHEAFSSPLARRMVAACVLCVGLTGVVFLVKANPQDAQNSTPNYAVEGDWVRTDTNASGSFDGLNHNIAPPELTPEGQKLKDAGPFGRGGLFAGRGPAGTDNSPRPDQNAPQDAPHQAGQPYVIGNMPCGGNVGNGAGSFGPDSGGIHLIIGKTEVVFSQERGGNRIIYMDGRPQPDESNNPHPKYFSIGRWDNGDLVVDTVGRTGGMIPGGGVLEATTHTIERYEVSPDNQHMKIVYTYTDPKLYAKPFSYAYTFDRAPNAPTYAFEEWCDASDPIEGQSIVPPEQK